MQTHIVKWGNSLALRVPASMAQELRVSEGTQVQIIVEQGKLVVSPPKVVPFYTLEELLDGITEANLHGEISVGPAVGNEW
jgi:antitoxin MazE